MKCVDCKYFHRDFLFGGGGWCEGDPTEIRRIKEIFAVLDTPCDIIDKEGEEHD